MKNMNTSTNVKQLSKYIQILNKRCKAITLIEVSIGLVIIGLMTFAALKGWKWVESTRLNSTISQILQIQSAHQSFKQTTHKNITKWQDITPFGGPTPNEHDQVASSIGANFRIVNSNLILSPLNALQAYQIKNSLDQNPDLSKGWITVSDTSNNVKTTLDLNTTAKEYQLNIELS
jgi:hypothetical protein